MSLKSPTARTMAALRSAGWTVEVVERCIPGANIRRDLFGVIDVLAIREGETLGVQATSASNVSARVRKLSESDVLPAIRKAGWRLEVWGWRRVGRSWTARRVDLS